MDYDNLCLFQVIIYAGSSTSSRKVAEYGGNTYGFGSRSVLGTGWPTDQVKVEGDTVTFSFEMRSGREHNTPDRAIWGFACSVRAQESGILFILPVQYCTFQYNTCQPVLSVCMVSACLCVVLNTVHVCLHTLSSRRRHVRNASVSRHGARTIYTIMPCTTCLI